MRDVLSRERLDRIQRIVEFGGCHDVTELALKQMLKHSDALLGLIAGCRRALDPHSLSERNRLTAQLLPELEDALTKTGRNK